VIAQPSGPTAHNDRILFIGLDAGDAALVEQWCLDGWLPNISRMKSQGSWARMKTTAEIFHVSAWPSIFTGTTPDKHGLYHAYVMRPGHQGLLRPRPDQTPFPFLWKLLSDQGKRSVVMDAFLTCPLREFNGVQIVDWGSWSWFWEPTMIPGSLKQEIRRKFGPYPSDDHSKVGMTPVDDIAGFRRRLLAAVQKKTEVLKWLIRKEAWDFFLVVFGECHPAGHYFWHLYDSSYITHPNEDPEGLHTALRDIYVALDSAVGELLGSVDRRTTVWLVSGDGMTANYSGSHILTDVLTRMGALNASSVQGGHPASGGDAGRRDVLSTLRNMIPETVRLAISRALLSRQVQEQLSLRWKTAGISWPETRAFVIENANEGYIRVNLKGREPEGTVSPGEEYENLCEEIYRTARSFINPATGQAAALAVYKTDDSFGGPCRDHMPDLVIVWDPGARVTTELSMEQYGLVRVEHPNCGVAPYYTGNHWPNAFVAAVGPGVPDGLTLQGASILDLAPTILARFGVEIPAYMDGRVLPELTRGTRITG
jgi:predicted AlkP superfamily phosphohydrolase/phosphomutase